jgi:hypothetical protein
MQFVRAPDENVYIAPFNLIELVVAAIFEWWMERKTYEHLNDIVMGVLYSPLLVVAAYFETRTAHDIHRNRSRGEEDDDTVEEWEQMIRDVDFEAEGWTKKVHSVKSNVEEEPAVLEVRKLQVEVAELKEMLIQISASMNAGKGPDIPTSGDQKGKLKELATGLSGETKADKGDSSSSSRSDQE